MSADTHTPEGKCPGSECWLGGCAEGSGDLDVGSQGGRTALFVCGSGSFYRGGGTRTACLAEALAELGWRTVLWGPRCGEVVVCEGSRRRRLRAPADFPPAPTEDLGFAFVGAPQSAADLAALRRQGWLVVHDLAADWPALAAAGDAPWYQPPTERLLVEGADLLTCSAEGLQERARALGCDRTPIVISNGGPVRPWGQEAVPEDMVRGAAGTAVYVGSLYGQRFDWALLLQTARDLPQVAFNLVGHFENVPQADNLNFVGPRGHAEAMRYVVHADVGLLPFREESLSGPALPLKWYAYLSGGCPVAGSAALPQLRGRPWTFCAEPGAVSLRAPIEAALRAGRPDGAEVAACLAESSWPRRAQALVAAVAGVVEHRTQTRRLVQSSLVERPHLRPEDCRLRATWAGPSTCNMTPPCPYCAVAWSRALRPLGHARTPEVVLQALLRLAVERGPLYLSVCYGEPLVDDEAAGLLGTLARYSKLDLVSNLTFPLERLRYLPRNGNVAFCASFHPHYWGGTADFIAKRQAVQEAGFVVGVTEVVAYPPVLARLPGWLAELQAAGVPCGVLPFAGQYEGRQYPAAYTEAEWAEVLGGLAGFYAPEHQDLARGASPAGCRCACGHLYVWVDWDGTVRRCAAPNMPALGNLYDGTARLTAGPTPCTGTVCPCPDLWQFIVEEAGGGPDD